jgi:hypothetical protein
MHLIKCTLVTAIVFFTLPCALDPTELRGVKAARPQKNKILFIYIIYFIFAATSMIVIDVPAKKKFKFFNLI